MNHMQVRQNTFNKVYLLSFDADKLFTREKKICSLFNLHLQENTKCSLMIINEVTSLNHEMLVKVIYS